MLSKDDLQNLSPVARADHLGDRISRLAAQMTTGEHALVHAIADFDRSGAFVEHGALSTVQWLGYRVGMSAATACEKLRVGHALRELPKSDAAFATAKLSYSKVRALTRVATRENEAELLEIARCATASQLERICRHYRAVTCEATPIDAQVNRFVSVRQTDHGSTRITIQLPPDEGARFVAALDAARAELNDAAPSAENDGPRADRADAVMAVAESFFESGTRPRRSGSPHEVVVHVDAAALAESSAEGGDAVGHIENAGGQGIGADTARRLCCDASISGLLTDGGGKVLDAGRKQRTVPAATRRALAARAESRCPPTEGRAERPAGRQRSSAHLRDSQTWDRGNHRAPRPARPPNLTRTFDPFSSRARRRSTAPWPETTRSGARPHRRSSGHDGAGSARRPSGASPRHRPRASWALESSRSRGWRRRAPPPDQVRS